MNDLMISHTWNKLTPAERRDKLVNLEATILKVSNDDPSDIPPTEYFCNGVYAREITIPAGTTLVGEIHNFAQINVVSRGSIRVATEEGVKTIEAPCTFISPAGTKRAGYALTDTVWTVFHATEHTNEEDIRAEFIAPSYEELDKRLENNNVMGSSSSGGYSGDDSLPNQPSEEG